MIIFALIGLLVGFLSGLLGIGGGIILVPCLNHYFRQHLQIPLDLSMHMAVTDSLAVVIFTSMMTASLYYRQGKISWRIVWNFFPGLVFGGLTGFLIKRHLHGDLYAQVFAVFLIFIAIQLFYSQPTAQTKLKEKPKIDWKFLLMSFITGLLSSIFGVGGGIITTPFFIYLGLDILKAIGSSSACCIPVAFINSAITTWWQYKHPETSVNLIDWQAVLYISVFSVTIAPIGAMVAKKSNPDVLKKYFSSLLVLISLELFWNSLG
jgi:uncharacterized membrane protein YfcA